ncbi:MAG: HesA/MoeB/ThiF family protein [Solirubrobacterales bacterium]
MSDRVELRHKHALVIGLGARGSVAAAYLAAAGIGRIGLIDGAFVEEHDLRAGPLVFRPDLGDGKADGLAVKLGLIDAEVHAEPFPAFLDEKNAELIVKDADVVIDCTGTDASRLLVNDACLREEVSLVSGAATPDGGWWKPVVAKSCLRGFVDESASEATASNDEDATPADPSAAGVVAAHQAAAALQILQASGRLDSTVLHEYEASTGVWADRPVACSEDCICTAGSAAGTV